LSSIQQDKTISTQKEKIETPGKKDDTWIFRMVAQSRGNFLPAKELTRNAMYEYKHTSIHKTLKRLCPPTDDIPGTRLFCYNDLIRETNMPDGEYEDLLIKLRGKLKDSYDHLLQWHNWRKIKPIMTSKEWGKKVITIRHDDNNLITLKLVPKTQAIQDQDKAILTFRKKKFDHIDDVSKYTIADSNLLRFCRYGRRNTGHFSFKITEDYITGKIPLIPERKGQKLYFQTLAENTYYSNKYTLSYLDCGLNEKGQRLVKFYEEYIDKILNSNSSSKEKNKKRISNLREKISKIYDKREYQAFSMNIRGLLSYALDESNYNEFNKSIENLAEYDEYQEVRESIDTYNDLGQRSGFPIYFNYMIKRNFPFLSHYNDFKHILSKNFAAKLIKKIAKRLKYILNKASPDHLKYVVTKQFFDEIKPLIQANENNNNRIDDNDHDVSKAVEHYYISEISTYLDHIKKRDVIQQQNIKVFQNIKNRRNSLMEKLHGIIKNNDENNNNEVIPIYDSIMECRLS
jgi:hypothetical protein